jgi:predicted nucleic acid-binding protein
MADDTTVAIDTSVAVALLMSSHVAHHEVRHRLGGQRLVLTQHSLVETYSVLTRLPGDARVAAADAVHLIEANFGPPALIPKKTTAAIPALLAGHNIVGGAVYDALVALAARSNALPLATRDLRAAATYRALGVEVIEVNEVIDHEHDQGETAPPP